MLIPFKSKEELEKDALNSGVHRSKVGKVISRNCHTAQELNEWVKAVCGVEFNNSYESFPKELIAESPSSQPNWVTISKIAFDWAEKIAVFSQEEVDRTPYVFTTDFYKAAR